MGGTNYYKSWNPEEQKAYTSEYGTPRVFGIIPPEQFRGIPTSLSNQEKAFNTRWQQQQQPQQNQQQQADYWRAVSNAQNAASMGQQNVQQQMSGYNQAQQNIDMASQTQAVPNQPTPALPTPAKGVMQANPLGAKAAAAASANQIGAGSNQFTLPATSGITFGGT